MTKNRVVITGLGTVNPVGVDVPSFWDGLMQGNHGISSIEGFNVDDYSTRFAGQILEELNYGDLFDKKEIRRTSRFILFAVYAAHQAVINSGLDVHAEADRIGVEIGSGIGGIEILEKATQLLHSRGPSKVSPFTVPMMICDMAAGMVAIKLGAKGPNSCSVTACASSAHSMGNAFRLVQSGDAVAMIAGGSEACVTPLGLSSFCAARSLSQRNDDPGTASRPFDRDRDGFVMGEGAGVLVFEEYEHAVARGADILAEVVGFGSSGDAYHLTAPAPDGEGAKRAMKMALDMAEIGAESIDYINAHGTSTLLNDKNETQAIKDAFGDSAYSVQISSTKSMTGHLLGAAGALELIICTKAIQTGVIPPTINLDNPDEGCDLRYTPHESIEKKVSYAMSNSFGFGGHNAVLIIKSV